MTWRGCCAGRFRQGGLWHYCTSQGNYTLTLTVEGGLEDGASETVDVAVCAGHKAAIEARPGAWRLETGTADRAREDDDRPRIFAHVGHLQET